MIAENMSKSIYKRLVKCRVCGSNNLVKYLNLGRMPLANSLVEPKDRNKEEKKFPLEMMYCKNCCLSQLSIVVNPELLFSNYPYRSSISNSFRMHCAEMADNSAKILKTTGNKLVVDIASNDGCLLQEFRKKGFRTIGVEPAGNLAKIAEENGIKTINSFWNEDTANHAVANYGRAKIITATNILAHVDDLNGFIRAVKIMLSDDGLFIVEVPHMLDLVKKNEFDTIYHEHLSYFLVKPLQNLYNSHDLNIVNIEKYPIHGGTIRLYASKNSAKVKMNKSVDKWLNLEKMDRMYDMKTYKKLEKKVKNIKKKLVGTLRHLKGKGKKIGAYGASAKGNTLLNYCGIDGKLVSFIIDDTPEKQNHLAPGSKIRIVDAGSLESEKPDYLLLLAWNFAKELMQKTNRYRKSGMRYIIPIPDVRIK